MLTRDGYYTREIKMRIAIAKEAFNKKNVTLDKQAKHWTEEEIGQVLCLEHCFIWLRDLDTKKIGVELFGKLQNVVLEENGEDKMVKESKQWTSSWLYRREEDTSK